MYVMHVLKGMYGMFGMYACSFVRMVCMLDGSLSPLRLIPAPFQHPSATQEIDQLGSKGTDEESAGIRCKMSRDGPVLWCKRSNNHQKKTRFIKLVKELNIALLPCINLYYPSAHLI